MSFVLSKVLWWLIAPSNLLLLALAAGLVLQGLGLRWAGAAIFGLGAVGLAAAVLLPAGPLLASMLEDRFPQAAAAPVDGVVVLGGSVEQRISAARGQIALLDSAERLTVAAALARRFPGARLVFTGGSGLLDPDGLPGEAALAERFWREQGLDTGRITFEGRSRNTWENATETLALVRPGEGERWLLLTSALHMPRAIGCFRRAGWRIEPFPVDYTTGTAVPWLGPILASERLRALDAATREWVGLAAYRLMDRTDALLPAP